MAPKINKRKATGALANASKKSSSSSAIDIEAASPIVASGKNTATSKEKGRPILTELDQKYYAENIDGIKIIQCLVIMKIWFSSIEKNVVSQAEVNSYFESQWKDTVRYYESRPDVQAHFP